MDTFNRPAFRLEIDSLLNRDDELFSCNFSKHIDHLGTLS